MIDDELTSAVRHRATQFASQLRLIERGVTAVPNLEWNVAELAQHVACLPGFWHQQHEAGPVFEQPDDFAAFSNAARSHITDTEPAALADRVEHEFEVFLDDLAASDERGDRWLYGITVTPSNLCGMALNELILHGRDLAAVTKNEAPNFESFEALAAVEGVLKMATVFVDEGRAAAQPDGVYHVRFRGGKSYTWTKKGATLTISEGRPGKADAHLVADPATFLLSSLGRISQLRAGLSGKMISYGRKPWRFFGLGNISIDGA